MGLRVLLGLLALALVAACSDPLPPASVRPGISSATDLDRLRPASGVTYRFVLTATGVPVPGTLQLRSQRINSRTMLYKGALGIPLPAGPEAEEVAALFQSALQREGLAVRGGQLLIPTQTRTDNRFRSTSSALLRQASRFVPHDCFAVLGSCAYTAIRSDGVRARVLSETTESGGIWTTQQRFDPRRAPSELQRIRVTMVYSLGRDGVMRDLAITTRGGPDGPSRMTFRRK